VAEDRAGECEERLVDLGVAFVADPEAAEVVQVREAALDDPALAAEVGAVLDAAFCDDGFDPAVPEQTAVLVVVIAAVGEQPVGLLAWTAWLAGDRPCVQVLEERDQLCDVVAVAAGQRDRERDPGRVDEQVVLGAGAATIDRGRPGQEPPKSARIWLASAAARDQLIFPAALSLLSNRRCSASQTPACCQLRSRRQHVTPDPYP